MPRINNAVLLISRFGAKECRSYIIKVREIVRLPGYGLRVCGVCLRGLSPLDERRAWDLPLGFVNCAVIQ